MESVRSFGTQIATNKVVADVCNLYDTDVQRTAILHNANAEQAESAVFTIPGPPNEQGVRQAGVVTSVNFPNELLRAGFDKALSLKLASQYVDAYSVMVNAVRARKLKPPIFNGSFEADYWHADYSRNPITVIHRGAGFVALRSCGQTKPLEAQRQQYGAHIAGLINPLDANEFRSLYTMFERKRSGIR